jgi:N,N'-diacetyllegionaminate synthase
MKPYVIIEVANSHGGDFVYLLELIESFSTYSEGYGIKFQPFNYDTIATQDYSYYELYQKLKFDSTQWEEVISKSSKTKDVWLDLFDTYGVQILQENIDKVHGIKFQSSVLFNNEIFADIARCDLSDKKIILNVAAQSIDSIEEIIARVTNQLNPQEILLEFGYQAYPTSLEDSGYSKIDPIRSNFNNRLVFADHVDGESEESIFLPIAVALAGVEVIEKHVMLSSRETLYDHYSSLTPEKFSEMIEKLQKYSSLKEMPFINEKELDYLKTTVMIPILKTDKKAGSLLDLDEDFLYRRSGKQGLNINEIKSLQENFHVLATDKQAGQTLLPEDFRKAVIGTIIACRLKSSRLPKKAILKIGEISSIERCIKSCLEIRGVNHTILATSDNDQDSKLKDYTYRSDVIFHTGDAEDVIKRYLGIIDELKIDVIVRVTGDMPYVSHEIVEETLRQHFLRGADYSNPNNVSVGTGAEVINTNVLREIKHHFPDAKYSEYMTWYITNNAKYFRINKFDLSPDIIRNYRITLDYPEDLEMFNQLQAYFDKKGKVFEIREAFKYLDEHPEISSLNSHLTLRYQVDKELISKLNKYTKIMEAKIS